MAHPLIPLLVLAVVVGVACLVVYVVYSIANDVAGKTTEKMEQKNVTFGKEGLKIGMKHVKDEEYVEKTQSVLVKAWNHSTLPAYKSRFWKMPKRSAPSSPTSQPPRHSQTFPSFRPHSSSLAEGSGSTAAQPRPLSSRHRASDARKE